MITFDPGPLPAGYWECSCCGGVNLREHPSMDDPVNRIFGMNVKVCPLCLHAVIREGTATRDLTSAEAAKVATMPRFVELMRQREPKYERAGLFG